MPASPSRSAPLRARKARENRQSYLFIDFSETSVDEVIEYALAGGFGIKRQQQGVVIEHFLEMRDGPVTIHGISEKTAVEMVTQTAA